ncbi:hypothetical protein L6164_023876 [Bauhinia variegata]|uniref:Uncharacterized protein n=1 Tax=Bauhinia variegata TaxID=167791 RepID=A0ACB9MJP7_BAUVA|nr:hypothetical protein L6164_023876 [Bauhinia variegata]
MTDKAMEIYELMKTLGYAPDKLTFAIMIKHLGKVGEQELLATLKEECDHYVDPARKVRHVEQKHANQRYLNSV